MKNSSQFLFLFLTLLAFSLSNGQTSTKEIFKTNWKGFERINFKIEGKEAQLTCPEKPLPENPWLWRGRFPGYHATLSLPIIR